VLGSGQLLLLLYFQHCLAGMNMMGAQLLHDLMQELELISPEWGTRTTPLPKLGLSTVDRLTVSPFRFGANERND
jgi:hypothetical protein